MTDDFSSDVWEEQDDAALPQSHWYDRFGWLARRFRFGKPVAEREWMGYYNGLYTERGPSVELFSALLRRNGLWFVANPFYEGNPHFYRYCADGVTLADVDYVLTRWSDRFSPRSPEAEPRPTPMLDAVQSEIQLISQQWEALYRHQPHLLPGQSIAVTEERNRQNTNKTHEIWEQDALHCLRVLFASSLDNWQWMERVVHKDNIRLLCKIVYDNAPLSHRPFLLAQWKTAGWVSDATQKWFQ